MSYRHVQRSWLHFMLLVIAMALFIGAGLTMSSEPVVALFLLAGAIVFGLLTSTFAHLLIEDRGDHLFIQFGPLGVFRKRVPYSSIRSLERGRSTPIDGIGIHWIPGRGWIWNIAAGACIELELDAGKLRLGTDDADHLQTFLDRKITRSSE